MPLPKHFTEHALRQALNDEFHARPPVPLQSPQLISYVAMHHEGEAPGAALQHLILLGRQLGQPIDAEGSHRLIDFGSFKLKWELHNEFSSYTFFCSIARGEGLEVARDRAGNLVFSDPADTRNVPAVWVGSHMDSVPQGGNFDGLAGIVAGMLMLLQLRGRHEQAPPLRVLALRGEESAWYGKAYLGSLSLLGKLPAATFSAATTSDAAVRNFRL